MENLAVFIRRRTEGQVKDAGFLAHTAIQRRGRPFQELPGSAASGRRRQYNPAMRRMLSFQFRNVVPRARRAMSSFLSSGNPHIQN